MMKIQNLLIPEMIETMDFHYWVKKSPDILIYLENGKNFYEAFCKASRKKKISWFAHIEGNFTNFLRKYQEQTEDYFNHNYLDAIIERDTSG